MSQLIAFISAVEALEKWSTNNRKKLNTTPIHLDMFAILFENERGT